MELVQHLIEAVPESTADLRTSRDEVWLMPIGDIQWGTHDCDVDRVRRHVEWGLEHGVYFLGMGDYIDFASPSSRRAMHHALAEAYDVVRLSLDDMATELVQRFLEETGIGQAKDRFLGLLSGHHFWQFQDGTTSDSVLANELRTPFLGSCAFVRLRLPATEVTIWCHHGVGGGITLGAPLNRLERLVSAFDADIYLIGHHHKLVAAPIDTIYPVWKRRGSLRHRTRLLACTGSFMRGYTAHRATQGIDRGIAQGSYVEQKMLPPVALGGLLIKIRAKSDGTPDLRVEV